MFSLWAGSLNEYEWIWINAVEQQKWWARNIQTIPPQHLSTAPIASTMKNRHYTVALSHSYRMLQVLRTHLPLLMISGKGCRPLATYLVPMLQNRGLEWLGWVWIFAFSNPCISGEVEHGDYTASWWRGGKRFQSHYTLTDCTTACCLKV